METDHKVASKDFNPTAGENIENALSTEPGKNLQENATLCGDEQTSHKRTGNSFTSFELKYCLQWYIIGYWKHKTNTPSRLDCNILPQFSFKPLILQKQTLILELKL